MVCQSHECWLQSFLKNLCTRRTLFKVNHTRGLILERLRRVVESQQFHYCVFGYYRMRRMAYYCSTDAVSLVRLVAVLTLVLAIVELTYVLRINDPYYIWTNPLSPSFIWTIVPLQLTLFML